MTDSNFNFRRRLQPVLINRLVLNIKWAAYCQHHPTDQHTMSSLVIRSQGPQSRMDSLFGDIVGPVDFDAEDVNADNDAEDEPWSELEQRKNSGAPLTWI